MANDPSRTYHATQAMQLSELIGLKFAPLRYGKANPRIVKVQEPDGPSTDGGRKARQAMLLIPQKGEGNTIVFGFIDMVKRSAELRSYAALKQQYEARFHEPIDLEDDDYGKLLGTMRDYLMLQQVSFELVDHVPPSRAASVTSHRPNARDDDDDEKSPLNPLVLGFAAGTVFGFMLCYLLLRVL
jgi:translation initiation factor IF-2